MPAKKRRRNQRISGFILFAGMILTSLSAYLVRQPAPISVWMVLVTGVMLSVLLSGLFYALSSTKIRAQKIADRLTQEIIQREQQLKESEQRWRFAIEGAGDGLWDWDLAKNTVYYSPRWQAMLGLSGDEVSHELSVWESRIHPEDKARTLAALQSYIEGRSTGYRAEYRLQRKNGSWMWILDRGMVMSRDEQGKPARMLGTNADITERKEADLALRNANDEAQQFRQTLDYVTSFIYLKDTQSRYIYANQATLTLFKCSATELKGKDDFCFFAPETANTLQGVDSRVLKGEKTSEELDVEYKDGTVRHYLEIKAPIYDSRTNNITGLVGISTDISLLKEQQRQLEHIARYDQLAQLPNRALFFHRLHQAVSDANRRKEHLALVFIDLDGFKSINDTYGHDAGDQLLVLVSKTMSDQLRTEDTLARIGGDEFVAILMNVSLNQDALKPLLERLIAAASAPIVFNGKVAHVGASLGVTFYPVAPAAPGVKVTEPEQLLREADAAMYQAKVSGKGRYCFFSEPLPA